MTGVASFPRSRSTRRQLTDQPCPASQSLVAPRGRESRNCRDGRALEELLEPPGQPVLPSLESGDFGTHGLQELCLLVLHRRPPLLLVELVDLRSQALELRLQELTRRLIPGDGQLALKVLPRPGQLGREQALVIALTLRGEQTTH